MQSIISKIFFLLETVFVSATIIAQPTNGTRPDTTRRPTPGATQGPKPYKEVITSKAVSDGRRRV
jgi:hypothetical protein